MHDESFYPIWYVKEKRELLKQSGRIVFAVSICAAFIVGYFTLKNYKEYRELCNQTNSTVVENLVNEECNNDAAKLIDKMIFINKLFTENNLQVINLDFIDNILSCKIEEKNEWDLNKIIKNLEEYEYVELLEVSFNKENEIELILSME